MDKTGFRETTTALAGIHRAVEAILEGGRNSMREISPGWFGFRFHVGSAPQVFAASGLNSVSKVEKHTLPKLPSIVSALRLCCDLIFDALHGSGEPYSPIDQKSRLTLN
jgi:hypothetical protein